MEEIVLAQRTVIPALSGWFVAEPIHDGKDWSICAIDWEPVIAWMVVVNSRARDRESEWADTFPVTVQGNHSDAEFILRRPDGSYTMPCVQEFKTEQEIIAYLNEEAQKELERRKRRDEKEAS